MKQEKILVTGGAGYIGSHVNKLLNQRGYETVVFDNLVYGHPQAVKWGILETGDLADVRRLEEVFRKYKITAVLHFAAYAYVGESVTKPSKYYNNNVVNTLHLLDVMAKYDVKDIVFSSTCATYGVQERMPITEEAAQKPINPYGASKLMIERIMEDYGKAYGFHYCCLRYFNAAGADPEGEIGESHMPETHIIPLVLAAAAGDRKNISIFGGDYPTRDGSCIRDYIHVSDLADAHLLALDYVMRGGSICLNLGNGRGTSVLELIKAAEKVTGKTIPTKMDERREGDPSVLTGNSEKAVKILGWKPQYCDIDVILRHAWNWYMNKNY